MHFWKICPPNPALLANLSIFIFSMTELTEVHDFAAVFGRISQLCMVSGPDFHALLEYLSLRFSKWTELTEVHDFP